MRGVGYAQIRAYISVKDGVELESLLQALMIDVPPEEGLRRWQESTRPGEIPKYGISHRILVGKRSLLQRQVRELQRKGQITPDDLALRLTEKGREHYFETSMPTAALIDEVARRLQDSTVNLNGQVKRLHDQLHALNV